MTRGPSSFAAMAMFFRMEFRVVMDVDDLDKALAFYTGGLGLRVGRKFDDEFVELVQRPRASHARSEIQGARR